MQYDINFPFKSESCRQIHTALSKALGCDDTWEISNVDGSQPNVDIVTLTMLLPKEGLVGINIEFPTEYPMKPFRLSIENPRYWQSFNTGMDDDPWLGPLSFKQDTGQILIKEKLGDNWTPAVKLCDVLLPLHDVLKTHLKPTIRKAASAAAALPRSPSLFDADAPQSGTPSTGGLPTP